MSRSPRKPASQSLAVEIACLEADVQLAQVVYEWLNGEDLQAYFRLRLGQTIVWSMITTSNAESGHQTARAFLGIYFQGWDASHEAAAHEIALSKKDTFCIGVRPVDTMNSSLASLLTRSAEEVDGSAGSQATSTVLTAVVMLEISARTYAIGHTQNEPGIEQLIQVLKKVGIS